jgi:hypothetical protein
MRRICPAVIRASFMLRRVVSSPRITIAESWFMGDSSETKNTEIPPIWYSSHGSSSTMGREPPARIFVRRAGDG